MRPAPATPPPADPTGDGTETRPRRRVFRSYTAISTGSATIALAAREAISSPEAKPRRVPAHRVPRRASDG